MATNSSPAEGYVADAAADPVGGAPAEPVVAVIGSARLAPPDPRCALAAQLGAAIAERGWATMTGGYGGLMAVASQAAAEAGGTVIGLPMSGWTGLEPNQWNHELRWSQTYADRLAHLMTADVVVALDGGIGTLSEAAVVWAALQTEPGAADLVFLGAGWPPVLQSLASHLVVDDRDLALITICTDAQQVIAHIEQTRSRQQRTARPLG